MEPQPAVAPSPDSHPRQWAIFTQLDEDGSGTLDLDEIYNYLADMNEGVANELMQALDTNNDGEVDFTEFCAGWDTVFFVTGDKKFEDGGDGGGAGDDGGGSLAALTVQRHYRGHQARRELAFRETLREDRAAAKIQSGWRAKHPHKQQPAAGGDGDVGRRRRQELTQLEESRWRQQDEAIVAANLRRVQEEALEAAALEKEAEYLRRMRGGLARRGMLGATETQDEEQMADNEGTMSPALLMPSVQQSLSTKVAPLTTPSADLSTQEVIRWGGSEGLRLVLKHNLQRVSFKGAQRRTLLSTVTVETS